MSLATIRVNSKMKMSQLVNAINNNFQQIENINRTQILKDKTGVPRIIIGEFPDGKYGIIVSKEGTDVTKLFS